ncbi:TetR/AcrR family transcriptional regulator [Granulicella sp. dw_53]|uniref:TetR/AcrR family transcriptional regulator n=1 Tax=Granulicella sp. dw_53 TaxID=2719792 RepID=UPI001BD514F6|nr:TetR/AcrR family transcriptional regulator [Granulicella sp. dw_53]
MNAATKTAKVNGRPREFDLDKATEKAMLVFWKRGYEGASVAELTEVMGISKPSLYAAFGDKRGLFEAALLRYDDGPRAFAAQALKLPTAKETVRTLLEGAVEVSTRRKGPRGCLQTQAALACGPEADEVKDMVSQRRLVGEGKLRSRLRQAQSGGELPAKADVGVLARYVASVGLGITVQAASGVSRKELMGVVEMVMRGWPAVGRGASSFIG